jgi:hypothetical protein
MIPFILLFAGPIFASRRWYWSPLFFAYGAFSVIPAAMYHFGPRATRGHLRQDPPNAEYTIAMVCCSAGLLAAVIGYLSARASQTDSAKIEPAGS